jgi:hypothetical protein
MLASSLIDEHLPNTVPENQTSVKHSTASRFWAGRTSRRCPHTRGQKLRTAQKQSPTPITTFQKAGKAWSARVGIHHRVIAVEAEGGFRGYGLITFRARQTHCLTLRSSGLQARSLTLR